MRRSPSPRFQSAMAELASLTGEMQGRRHQNLERMRAMTARLDDPIYGPSVEPITANHSAPTPTPPPLAEDDGGGIRDALPQRSTKGGPYGRSILERVARTYGL